MTILLLRCIQAGTDPDGAHQHMAHRAARMTTAATAIALVAALAGCGGGSKQHNAAGVTAQQQTVANPVDILKKINGCALAAGETVGEQSAMGYRYASCSISDNLIGSTAGDQITVYTSTDEATLQADMAATNGGSSTDSTKIITGPGFYLMDTGSMDLDNGGTSFVLDPARVALAVGGRIQ